MSELATYFPNYSSKKKRRADEVAGLCTIIPRNGSLETTVIPGITNTTLPGHDNRYGELAVLLFNRLVSQAIQRDNEGLTATHLTNIAGRHTVLYGLSTMTRFLGFGPPAYANYLKAADQQGNVAELGNIMRRSSQVVRPFTDCGRKANQIYEQKFGFKDFPPEHEATPFVIGGEPGLEEFALSSMTHNLTKIAVKARIASEGLPPVEAEDRCPAVGRVMTALWNAGIDECIRQPELYQADLYRLSREPAL